MAKKICIVEDTPDLLKHLKEFLEMEAFEVWPCKNGMEALERLNLGIPDLIITDLRMSGMDGLTLIGKFRDDQNLRHVPVVVFSAAALHEYEREARELGIAFYQETSTAG